MTVDLKQFYRANPRRRSSPELRFGTEWKLDGRKGAWSCFWIQDNGELAVFRAGWGQVLYDSMVLEFLAWLLTPKSRANVHVLLVERDRAALEARLLGWEEQHANPDGLRWLFAAAASCSKLLWFVRLGDDWRRR